MANPRLDIMQDKDIPLKGEKHNAIDDCNHQVEYCHVIFKALMGGNKQSVSKA